MIAAAARLGVTMGHVERAEPLHPTLHFELKRVSAPSATAAPPGNVARLVAYVVGLEKENAVCGNLWAAGEWALEKLSAFKSVLFTLIRQGS